MYERSVLTNVFRVVVGVFACGLLLFGLLVAVMGGFTPLQLVIGLLVSLAAGGYAFRRQARIGFFSIYGVSLALIIHLSAPWRPLVNAVDSLKPGMTPVEVSTCLHPWIPGTLKPENSYVRFPQKYGQAEAIFFVWSNGCLVSAKIEWD